jgi:mannitol operon transcriptional antiterminator
MEIWISRRTIQILDYLLDQHEYVNIAQIAANLNLSPAQVRYSLDQLDPWLAFKELELVRKPRSGVRMRGPEAKKSLLSAEIKQNNSQSLVRSSDERRQLLLLQLLTAAAPLRQGEISRWLNISRPTLFRDIAYARTWITQRGLSIQDQRNHGFFVSGREILWRKTVLDLLVSNLDQDFVISYCAKSEIEIESTQSEGLLGDVSVILKALPVNLAERLVTAIERKTHLHLPDDRRLRLILCLSLTIYRLAQGKTIPDDEYGFIPELPPEIKEAASETKDQIEERLQRAIPPGEFFYIVECIQDEIEGSSRSMHEHDKVAEPMADAYADLASELVRISAQYLHPGLLQDRDFGECLALVLEQAACERATGDRFAAKTSNPTREDKEPLTLFTRRQLAPLLSSHGWNPSENLLDAITVHLDTALDRQRIGASQRKVWVVCGAGLATARNLVSRLNMHLPELKILGIASSFEIIHNPNLVQGADAVISTVKLNLNDVLMIHVSPLGTAEDIRRIQRMLGLWKPAQAMRTSKAGLADGVSLAHLLKEETIAIVDGAESWEEVVNLAGDLLQRAGAVWPSYIAAIKDMIVLYGPYMVIAPGMALLHAGPEMGAKRLAVSLVLLKKPVAFGHAAFDPVRVAMAFASVDHCSHLHTVGEIMSLMGDEVWREQVCRSATKAEIISKMLAGLR